jgi:hypothetical protein
LLYLFSIYAIIIEIKSFLLYRTILYQVIWKETWGKIQEKEKERKKNTRVI